MTLLAVIPAPVRAQDTERARLAAERQSLMERYTAQEQACRAQFVVTACLDEVRRHRREALRPLTTRERSLDEAERNLRAVDRLSARAAKAEARAAAAPASVQVAPFATSASARIALPRLPANATPAPGRGPAAGQMGGAAEARMQQAAERARASARRTEALNALQADVARREAERASNARRSAPLPPSSAPSAPAR